MELSAGRPLPRRHRCPGAPIASPRPAPPRTRAPPSPPNSDPGSVTSLALDYSAPQKPKSRQISPARSERRRAESSP